MATEIHKLMEKDRQEVMHFAGVGAEDAIVATTAAAPGDSVMVTLPNSEDPDNRLEVKWTTGVKFVAGAAQPRYPTRGDQGFVIETDSGDLWLFW